MSPTEEELSEYQEYCKQVEEEVKQEVQKHDPVHLDVTYHHFLSHSKGRGRKRRYPEEVKLVSYRSGHFHLWHKFPFDVYATECLGCSGEGVTEKFKQEIEKMGRE